MTGSPDGHPRVPDDLVARVAGPARSSRLTPRQRRLAGLLADGLANDAIAEELGVTPPSVARMITDVCRRLEVGSVRALVARVWRERLLALEMDARATGALRVGTAPKPVQLSMLLAAIEANDTKYGPRYGLVLTAVAIAQLLGYPTGFRIDPAEPDWPVAMIELPKVGQVSWHLPAHVRKWDGHSTEEKYKRVRAFIEQVA